MRLDRLPPFDDEYGRVRCRVCGLHWVTTPEQDALLRDLFEHDATHDELAGADPAADAIASIRAVRKAATHDQEAT